MKKTEKIEVRLSHEEKAELSKLADEEGRSVSELIRHLVKRYMSLNTGRLPRKLPWLALAVTGGVAFLAGHLLTYYIAKSHVDETTYSLYVRIQRAPGDINDDEISAPIFLRDGFTQSFVIPRESNDVALDVSIEKAANGLFQFNTSFCYQEKSECKIFAEPTLALSQTQSGGMDFETKDGVAVEFGVIPRY